MKDCVLAIMLAGAISGLIGCEEETRTDPELVLQMEEDNPVVESPPVEEEIPVEPPSQVKEVINAVELESSPSPVADNSLCHACHINLMKEVLASVHAQANIGCTRCHGASNAHRSDEDTTTPPDIMFPKAKIMSFCSECHTGDSINIPAHKTMLTETDPLKACCTDCHGEHRLNYRTRKWDKNTRNLIRDQRVRRLNDEMLER
ncbi:hypothetical protein ACFL5Z_02490 [Planctomycetota bacterium]